MISMNDSRKKKVLNLFLCLLVCIGALFPYFLGVPSKKTANAYLTYGDEIQSKQTILGTTASDIAQSDLKYAFQNQAPYSLRTNEMLPGYSITPETNKHNEIISQTFLVNNFTIKENESIYMWIYLPNSPAENFYSLILSFGSNNGGTIKWKYNFNKLIDIMKGDNTQKYGWKLFELCYSDAEKTSVSKDSIFGNITITYNLNFDDYKDAFKELGEIVIDDKFYDTIVTTTGKLTFYNIFLSDSYSEKSSVIFQLEYAYYGLNESFVKEFDGIYLKDTYKVKKLSEMFDYVFAGKYNLLYTGVQNNNFSWVISIQNKLGVFEVMTGENYTFKTDELNSFIISLKEKRDDNIESLFSETISFYCEEYTCGSFDNSYYNFKEEKVYVIPFKLTDTFILSGDIAFTSSNERVVKVESYEYNEESDLYFISVKCLKNGKVTLKASATGTREGFSTKNYVTSVNVVVNGITTSIFQRPFLLTMVALSLLCIVVFLVITAINFRRAKRGY